MGAQLQMGEMFNDENTSKNLNIFSVFFFLPKYMLNWKKYIYIYKTKQNHFLWACFVEKC
jgi:hypothetical protein